MKVTDFLVGQLAEHLMSASIGYRGEHLPQGILFLEPDTQLRQDLNYIADKDTFLAWKAAGNAPQQCYLFFTAGTGNVNDLGIPDNMTAFETNLPAGLLYNHVHNMLIRLVRDNDLMTEDGGSFADFLHAVLIRDITRADDIRERFRLYFSYPSDKYRVLVFEFADPANMADQKDRIFTSIRSVFPYSNAAVYFDRVVAIVQGKLAPDDSVNLPEDKHVGLEKICAQLKAWCGVSNETKNLAMVRTEYLHARKSVSIGRAMCENKKERIFCQEEYSAYLMMDLAYREFARYFGHSNYLYMLHPGISEVARYDQEHDGNCREVLYRYLQCDRNLTKTAEVLHMHRNTVIYKVNKAIELVGDDMEDPMIRMRLLWSCMMCEYCEKMLELPPNPFPR